ncbi:hypothetical protein AMJ57_00210 [Parcubacteria bacterium SG8_24]|nr:MAG: hypothetical protein AMJ57_00210 [Parcubacteria bacterium SG8_24]
MYSLVAAAVVMAGGAALATTVDTYIEPPDKWGGPTGQVEMVEAHCHRFKFMGGHAIANIEAAHEVLDAELKTFDVLGMNVRLSDYADNADSLRDIIDDSCIEPTLDQAKWHHAVFRAEAERIRNQFAGLQDLIKGDLESYIVDHQEQIRVAYEEELRKEVEDLESEAYARLEAQLRAEAESRKAEMMDRIQKQVEAELIAEYGGQEDPDIPYLRQLGEQRGRARGEAEAASIEAELRAKYDKLAGTEVEKLKAAAEEKAKEKEAEMREMMTGLYGVGDRINEATERKFAEEWAAYEDSADEIGQQVYKAFVEEEFARARNLIEAESGLVEQVPQEIRDRYGLRTTKDLLDELDADKAEVLATLANVTDIADTDTEAFREQFSKKWTDLREKFDYLKARSASIVMRRIEQALEREPGASSGRVENYMASTRKAMLDRKAKLDYAGVKCSTDSDYAVANCAMCNSLIEYRDMADYGMRVVSKIDECTGILSEFGDKRAMADAGALSVEQAMEYSRRVEACLTGLRAMHDPYVEYKALYDNSWENQQKSCR